MMFIYEVVKIVHITTVILSISGFILRGIWMMRSSEKLHNRLVKVIPHINDTFLLLSAIVLVVITAQYPVKADWINAKIIALVIYIVLGTIALKRGKTMKIRIVAWCLAILVFGYMFAVASSKTPIII